MIPMIHFTLHQNQTDDKCSPNSQAITTTSTEWWRRGGNTTLTEFTLSLSEKIFMCKVVFIFAKIPYKQNIIYLVILVKDVRVPIRCMHMQVDLSRVDLTFAQGKKDVCNIHLWCVSIKNSVWQLSRFIAAMQANLIVLKSLCLLGVPTESSRLYQ